MKIAVIGMGKIGLPLAVQYARKGHEVIGVDINSKTVDLINQGKEPFPEEAQLQKFLGEVIALKQLKATLSYEEAVSVADVIVVVVPLFVDENANPDFEAMDSATEKIGRYLRKGAVVCYETTLPIGTTRTRFTPKLEKLSGMEVGIDFSVVFSPERVFSGRIFEDLQKYPKIVGGITSTCTKAGVDFYSQVLDFVDRKDLLKPNAVWGVQSSETAEFVKLAETTYRDVNIALANQFAIYAENAGIDVFEVIESANTQPHSHIHKPGLSVGGHCIPVYPHFYLLGDKNASIVKEARSLNASMPILAVQKIRKIVGDVSLKNFVIYGVTYRENVKEIYNSGAVEIFKLLKSLGARVSVYDPLYTADEISSLGLQPYFDQCGPIDMLILHSYNNEMMEFISRTVRNTGLILDGGNWLQEDRTVEKEKVIVLGRSEIPG